MGNVLNIEIDSNFEIMLALREADKFEDVIMLAVETEKKVNLAYESELMNKVRYLEAIGYLGHIKDACYCLLCEEQEVNEYALELLYSELEGLECEVQYAVDMGYYTDALNYANKALGFIADNNLSCEHRKYFEDTLIYCVGKLAK